MMSTDVVADPPRSRTLGRRGGPVRPGHVASTRQTRRRTKEGRSRRRRAAGKRGRGALPQGGSRPWKAPRLLPEAGTRCGTMRSCTRGQSDRGPSGPQVTPIGPSNASPAGGVALLLRAELLRRRCLAAPAVYTVQVPASGTSVVASGALDAGAAELALCEECPVEAFLVGDGSNNGGRRVRDEQQTLAKGRL